MEEKRPRARHRFDFSGRSKTKEAPTTTDQILNSLNRQTQPSANIVKCFNTVPNSQMVDPKFKDVEMMICGNDPAAKQQVMRILKEFGWKGAIDIGGIENAGWLEAFVPLWARVGMSLNTWDHVFKVVR